MELEALKTSSSHEPETKSKSNSIYLKKIKELGSGAFKTVSEVEWNNTRYALIEINKHLVGSQKAIATFLEEIKRLEGIRHQNVVQIVRSGTTTENVPFALVELCAHGSLDKHVLLESKGAPKEIPVGLQWHWFQDLAQALVFLHSLKPAIIHRDIKSHNVLVDDGWKLKLTDFGLSRLQANSSGLQTQSRKAGTTFWMAPECFDEDENNKISTKADIWALGCVFLEICSREYPWFGYTEMKQFKAIAKQELPPQLNKVTDKNMKAIIERCLVHDVEKRATAKEVLELVQKSGADFLKQKSRPRLSTAGDALNELLGHLISAASATASASTVCFLFFCRSSCLKPA
jgi:serine/threonine protein kinase